MWGLHMPAPQLLLGHDLCGHCPSHCSPSAGPGVTNLTTALATANCEGDPIVALGGNVPSSQRYKATHQVRCELFCWGGVA